MSRRYDTEYRVGTDTTPAERGMKGLLSSSKRVATGMAVAFAGISLSVLTSQIQKVVAETSEIGKIADQVGVTTRAIQEYRYVTSLSGLATDAADKSLQEFNKRIGEAATGTGNLRLILEANGIALKNSQGSLRDTNDLLADYADLIANSNSQQAKSYLANEAFGRSGKRMINVLQAGSVAFNAQIKEARELGIAIDDDLIRKAEELDDRWNALTTNMSTKWRSTVLSVVDGADYIIDAFSRIENRREDTLSKSASLLRREIKAAEENLKSNRFGGILNSAYEKTIAHNQSKLKKLDKELQERFVGSQYKTYGQSRESSRRVGGVTKLPNSSLPGSKVLDSLRNEEIQLRKTSLERRIYNALKKAKVSADSGVGRAIVAQVSENEALKQSQKLLKENQSKVAKGREKSIQLLERQGLRIVGVTTALQFELEQITRTATEQEIHNQLRSAGVDISSKAGIEIASLVRELGKEKSAREGQVAVQELVNQRLVEAQQSQSYLVDTSLSGLESMILGTESVEDALKRMIVQMGIAAAKAALLGEGPLAGLFGGSTNLFSSGLQSTIGADLAVAAGTGGLFAKGGISNRPAIFGEDGPEAAVPLPDGRKIPVDLRLPTRASNDNALSVTYSPMIDARGADEAAVARLERVMADDRRQFENRVRGVVQDSRSRAVGL